MTRIAEQAGVSLSTVSHVLNQTRSVSEATRHRVLAAARELGYEDPRVGNAAQRTVTIGAVVPSVASPFHGELLDGISTEAARQKAEVLLTTTAEDPDREHAAVLSLIHRRVDAIALLPSTGYRDRTQGVLRNCGIPAVLLDRRHDNALDQILCEGESASETLVEHLLQLGHRRIGMLRGMAGLTTTTEREAGYRRAFSRQQLAVDDRYIIDGLSSIQGGAKATEKLIAMREPPTAIYSANNNMTLGAMSALRRLNIAVPDDLAFVGFDDLEWSEIVQPGLTCMAQPFFVMGVRAVTLLLERIARPRSTPSTVLLPASFEHRASCGCQEPRAE